MWPRPSLDPFRKGYTFSATQLSIEALRDEIANVQLQPQPVLPHFGPPRSERERPPAPGRLHGYHFFYIYLYLILSRLLSGIFPLRVRSADLLSYTSVLIPRACSRE